MSLLAALGRQSINGRWAGPSAEAAQQYRQSSTSLDMLAGKGKG